MVSLTETARSAYADRAVSFWGDRHGHLLVDRNRSWRALRPACMRSPHRAAWCSARSPHAARCRRCRAIFRAVRWPWKRVRAHIGLRDGFGTRSPGQADFPAVRQTFPAGRQERFRRCTSDPRGGVASVHAVRQLARNETQQPLSARHRAREGRVRDRTGMVSQIHAFLPESGVSLPNQGDGGNPAAAGRAGRASDPSRSRHRMLVTHSATGASGSTRPS
ncbi:Uncharacterised protein [Burkholderia oklahomensis]|nr:putative transposase [Burkholderia oklahomensis C6786]SUY27618.1 Uncharacterised protein [Burkholderia oklahomensis]